MKEKTVRFGEALTVMEKLISGEIAKNVAEDLGIHRQRVTDVKHMFPLFLGLPRKYDKGET
jgi:hypothetical protein